MAVIVTDIVKEYGAYYLNSGQNRARLLTLLLFGRETTKIAREIKTDNTVFQLAESNITSLVQPFQKQWTPKGDITFVPNPIQLFNLKVDMDIYPDDIEDNWLGFLASESQSRAEWPLIRYIMEEHLIKKIEEDLELKEYYKGVYAKPAVGTAGATGTSINGLKYLLQHNTKVNRLEMDPLEASVIYDQLEEAFEQIAEEYQHTKMLICVAPKWRRAFLKDKRSQGYYDLSSPNQIDDTLDFSPAKVKALPSMIGTDDLFITPEANLLHITKKGKNAAKFKVEESKRCVSIMTDWWEGFGFGLNEVVWTNVEAVTAPDPDAGGSGENESGE
jgi:hypothetical protein